LAQVGCTGVSAFRAGSFACNADTYRALYACGIGIDSSLNEVAANSGPDLRGTLDFTRPQAFEGVAILPMTVFRDGTGRLRPAQPGACSFAELSEALESAYESGTEHLVLLSHNFEMLRQDSSVPDGIVVGVSRPCATTSACMQERFRVGAMDIPPVIRRADGARELAKVSLGATLRRHGEQLARRILG
jgi:hypothetical protein